MELDKGGGTSKEGGLEWIETTIDCEVIEIEPMIGVGFRTGTEQETFGKEGLVEVGSVIVPKIGEVGSREELGVDKGGEYPSKRNIGGGTEIV